MKTDRINDEIIEAMLKDSAVEPPESISKDILKILPYHQGGPLSHFSRGYLPRRKLIIAAFVYLMMMIILIFIFMMHTLKLLQNTKSRGHKDSNIRTETVDTSAMKHNRDNTRNSEKNKHSTSD